MAGALGVGPGFEECGQASGNGVRAGGGQAWVWEGLGTDLGGVQARVTWAVQLQTAGHRALGIEARVKRGVLEADGVGTAQGPACGCGLHCGVAERGKGSGLGRPGKWGARWRGEQSWF